MPYIYSCRFSSSSFFLMLVAPAFIYVCKNFQKGEFRKMTINHHFPKPILNRNIRKKTKMISPRIELGTFCVLSRCHNQLDHETN